ncbi:unnamed protein product, partial [Ceratitis capitata]
PAERTPGNVPEKALEKNPVMVLSRKIGERQDEDKIENLETRRKVKSLHQRKIDYEEARRRIF